MRLDEQTGRTIARSVNRRIAAAPPRGLSSRGFRDLPWLEHALRTLEKSVGERMVGSGIARASGTANAAVIEVSKSGGALTLSWYGFATRPRRDMLTVPIVEFTEHAVARLVERAAAFDPPTRLCRELRGLSDDRLFELVVNDSLTELVTPSGRFPLTRDGECYIAKTFIPN